MERCDQETGLDPGAGEGTQVPRIPLRSHLPHPSSRPMGARPERRAGEAKRIPPHVGHWMHPVAGALEGGISPALRFAGVRAAMYLCPLTEKRRN